MRQSLIMQSGNRSQHKIWPKHLAKRWEIIQQMVASGKMTWEEALEPVIIIFHSCNSQNQLRGLYQALDDIDPTIPKPVAKSVSEWKQFGYSHPSSRFWLKSHGRAYFTNTTTPKRACNHRRHKMKKLKGRNPLYKNSIFNIWFRDKNNRPMQISTEDWKMQMQEWVWATQNQRET